LLLGEGGKAVKRVHEGSIGIPAPSSTGGNPQKELKKEFKISNCLTLIGYAKKKAL